MKRLLVSSTEDDENDEYSISCIKSIFKKLTLEKIPDNIIYDAAEFIVPYLKTYHTESDSKKEDLFNFFNSFVESATVKKHYNQWK